MDHESYLKHSAYYAALFGKFGERIPEGSARKIAADHGTTLANLREEEGLDMRNGTFGTLELVAALGY